MIEDASERRALQPRRVEQVVYRAATGEAVIDLRADGFINDVEQQVVALLEMGFREING